MSNGRLNQVLLVGEAGARLEVDLVPYGLACVSVGNANDAVARLKTTPFSFVVVTAALPDMTGPAFVDGLLRHFDPSTVVLLGDIDPAQAAQLQRSPKVAFFPGNVDGADVADFLFQRVGGSSPPLATMAPSTPPQPTFPGPGTARGMFGEAPRQPTASSFAPPAGSLPPTQNPWPGTSGTPAQPRPAQNGGAPFFAAFSAQPGTGAAAPMPPPSSTAPISSPPMSAGPDRATMERIEQMATEVAQANAEVITLRARLGAAEASSRDSAERLIVAEQRAARAEQEASSLRSEVDAARRSAIHQVAEVMALSDEGEPISAELDDLKSKVDMAESERDSAASQLNMVRAERDRLTSDLSAAQQALQERALEADGLRRQLQDGLGEIERARADAESMRHLLSDLEGRSASGAAALAEVEGLRVQLAQRDATIAERDAALAAQRAELEQQAVADVAAVRAMLEEQHGYALEALRADLEQAHSASVEAVRAEADAHHAADVEAQTEVRVYAAVAAEKKSAEAALAALQATLQAELDALRAEKADVEAAWAADQQRAAEADAKLGEAQAARVDLENGLRADLNEALKQLAEESDATALERARANRAVADSQSLRQMLESLTMEQARVVGEIEQLRPIAGEVDKARAMIIDMQRQLEAALGTDEDDGDTTKAIAEAVKAQTRDLLELGRAIEPFTWGLERATAFFQDKNIDGATEHLRALGLLQKTLERMKSELERVHSSSSSNGAEAN